MSPRRSLSEHSTDMGSKRRFGLKHFMLIAETDRNEKLHEIKEKRPLWRNILFDSDVSAENEMKSENIEPRTVRCVRSS